MATVEEILEQLAAERAEHEAAGRLAEVQRVDQEAIAHQALAGLRERRAGYAEAGDTAAVAQTDGQIAHWRAMVTVDADVDEPAPAGPAAAAADGEDARLAAVRETVRARRASLHKER